MEHWPGGTLKGYSAGWEGCGGQMAAVEALLGRVIWPRGLRCDGKVRGRGEGGEEVEEGAGGVGGDGGGGDYGAGEVCGDGLCSWGPGVWL